MQTLYEILECKKDSNFEEIKKNYQRLAMQCHPDKSTDSAENKRFIEIDKAWKILQDPKSREVYDAELKSQETEREPLLYGTYRIDELKETEDGFAYSCRCGGVYNLPKADIFQQEFYEKCLLECDQCSLTICVLCSN